MISKNTFPSKKEINSIRFFLKFTVEIVWVKRRSFGSFVFRCFSVESMCSTEVNVLPNGCFGSEFQFATIYHVFVNSRGNPMRAVLRTFAERNVKRCLRKYIGE